jgi:hypothetical protein
MGTQDALLYMDLSESSHDNEPAYDTTSVVLPMCCREVLKRLLAGFLSYILLAKSVDTTSGLALSKSSTSIWQS